MNWRNRSLALAFSLALSLLMPCSWGSDWQAAREAGEAHRLALLHCWRYSEGWRQFADPETGLLPRRLGGEFYWNAKDCAADNYPFMVLTAFFTDKALYEGPMHAMLATEQRLCNRLDRLPDDYDFASGGFLRPEYVLDDLLFGASEYVKDGLLPLTEWLGESPWSARMLGLLEDSWKHGASETPVGVLPNPTFEVGGELMQSLSRMYWMTGDGRYRDWCFQLAEYFFVHKNPLDARVLSLDDHGCEVIGGLAEAYYLAHHTAPERKAGWREPMHAILDRVLEIGRGPKGLLYMQVYPDTGKVKNEERTDNWGYNYLAFAVVHALDGKEEYGEAIRHVLRNLGEARDYPWEGDRPDGLADSLEGCLNLMNRYPEPEAAAWADYTARKLMGMQRDTGIFEGWYGDGNSARTLIMYALWKSRGVWLEPWRADLRVGAVRDGDGALRLVVHAEWPWEGVLRFDVPRHRVQMGIPSDYPRLNQFPEWFTVDPAGSYLVEAGGDTAEHGGGALHAGLPIRLENGRDARLRVRPAP